MKKNNNEPRTALLIRCTEEEAKAIREAAKLQRRTVSAFVLHAVMNRISVQQRLGTALRPSKNLAPPLPSA
jgi:uncharacterized protein (DUF1778 family)